MNETTTPNRAWENTKLGGVLEQRLICPNCGHDKWFARTVDNRTPILLRGESLKECATCGVRVKIINPPPEGDVVFLRSGQKVEEIKEAPSAEPEV
jgi:ribosomal protein S27AE